MVFMLRFPCDKHYLSGKIGNEIGINRGDLLELVNVGANEGSRKGTRLCHME